MKFWKRKSPDESLEKFMATIADVNVALAGLKTAFNALVAQGQAVYAQFQANSTNIASAADLDTVVAAITADTASVVAAQASITAVVTTAS